MPSHIFNRLGYWNDSINANLASARVARDWIKSGRGGLFDLQHALNNLEYAYLQLGKTKDTQDIIGQIDQASEARGGDPWGPIDARIYFDVETHAWADALNIEPPSKSPFDENFDVYWIHAIAEGRLGNPAAARISLEQFRKSSADWTRVHGWDDVFHLALMEAEAWTLFSEGKTEDAVRELSTASDFERNHPIYYADVLPRSASEMLGEMLLQMGKDKESCAAFRASLVLAPNTLNALNGLRACANIPTIH
jgi:tetratricopeptide (TPR) repeat protein